jgi:hypothetical protein
MDHNENIFREFLERQLSVDVPRLDVLYDIADEMQQRLLSLREHHFDIREKVVETLQKIYHIDLATLMPPDRLETYHQINAGRVIDYIRAHGIYLAQEEKQLLVRMIEASANMATQLQEDIDLTQHLLGLLLDWLSAMTSVLIRGYWHEITWDKSNITHIH